MNQDIRISTGYRDHPKIRKLRKILGGDGIASHIFLLCEAGKYAFDGKLKDMDVADIEEAASWRGEPGLFVRTCVDLRLLDNNPDSYSIHHWEKWNKFAATFPIRSAIAKANIAKRWGKRDRRVKKSQGNQIYNTSRNTDGNTPTPTPTPSPKGSGGHGTLALEGEAATPQTEPEAITEEYVIAMAKEIEKKHKVNGLRTTCLAALKRGVLPRQIHLRLLNAHITGYSLLRNNIKKIQPAAR